MEAKLGDRFSLGSIPTGQERIVIPITGGTFKGPRVSGKWFERRVFPSCSIHCNKRWLPVTPPSCDYKTHYVINTIVLTICIGTILNLGADWRLTDAQGKFRPDARYNLQTDDGTYVYVQTEGLPPAADGAPSMLRGKFETDTNGTAAWMNDVAAVGVIRRKGTEAVLIDMWEVSALICHGSINAGLTRSRRRRLRNDGMECDASCKCQRECKILIKSKGSVYVYTFRRSQGC